MALRILAGFILTADSIPLCPHDFKIVNAVIGNHLTIDDYKLIALNESAHELVGRGDILIKVPGMSGLKRTAPAPHPGPQLNPPMSSGVGLPAPARTHDGTSNPYRPFVSWTSRRHRSAVGSNLRRYTDE